MRNERGNVLIVVFVIVVIAVAAAIFFVKNVIQFPNNKGYGGKDFSSRYGQGCKNKKVDFTYTPVALNNVAFIFPMGRMADSHVTPTDHAYIAPIDANAPEGAYDLVSPADGEVLSVQAMPQELVGDRTDGYVRLPEDNRIIVRFSCQYYAIFIHAHELAPKIKQAVGNLKPNQTRSINVAVKAGETIAKISGKWLDWSMNDVNQTLPGFISPSLYQSEPWKIHSIDPFSVYPQEIKSKLEALSPRSVAPFGGKIDYDEQGKAVGNWFREGTGGFTETSSGRFWDGHLAIAPDPIDTGKIVFSFGNWQGQSGQFIALGNFDPSSITASSGAVKIELTEPGEYLQADGEAWGMSGSKLIKPITMRIGSQVMGTVLLEVLPGEKLKLEKFPGKTAAEITGFTSAAQMFER